MRAYAADLVTNPQPPPPPRQAPLPCKADPPRQAPPTWQADPPRKASGASGAGDSLPVPPRAALRALLPPDVDLKGRLRHQAARPVWLGMVWGRLGRGELAWAWWDRVRLPQLQPWIAAERGRLLREAGHHGAAEAIEWPELVRADDPVDAAMLRISLTADAVGRSDPTRATSRLQAARTAVAELVDGPRAARQRLRLSWVAIEVAWLHGDRPTVDDLPAWTAGFGAPRFPRDYAAGSRFHAAKGLLFAGIVREDPRLLDAAAVDAPPALAWAVQAARADAGRVGAGEAARLARRQLIPPPSPEGLPQDEIPPHPDGPPPTPFSAPTGPRQPSIGGG